VAFYVAFGFFVVAILVIAFLVLRWVHRDLRPGRRDVSATSRDDLPET